MTPALVDGPWVTGSADALIGYVLTGGFGPEILMARFDYLTDAEMAAVLNFVRREYGHGGHPIDAGAGCRCSRAGDVRRTLRLAVRARSLRRRNSRLQIRSHPPLRSIDFVQYDPIFSSIDRPKERR